MVLTVSGKLMIKSLRQIDQAASAKTANGIFSLSFLAAMNAIGALISSRQYLIAGLPRPDSVWDLVPIAAPELMGDAAHFKALTFKRNLADRDKRDAVTRDEAEQMLAKATLFVERISEMLTDG